MAGESGLVPAPSLAGGSGLAAALLLARLLRAGELPVSGVSGLVRAGGSRLPVSLIPVTLGGGEFGEAGRGTELGVALRGGESEVAASRLRLP